VTIFLALCTTGLLTAAPIKVYPNLTLKDGRQFSEVEIINYTSSGILVRHAGGATVFRRDVLPEDVIVALHLQNWLADEPRASDSTTPVPTAPAGMDPAIADRPAIPESAIAGLAAQRGQRTMGAESVEATSQSILATAPIASESAAPVAIDNLPTSRTGEGNIPEFDGVQHQVISMPKSNYVNLGGRVVVTAPAGGLYLLGDVEVRGYPANLLPGYLVEAKAKCDAATRRLLDQANAAANESRFADYTSLIAQAHEMAGHYLDNLPAAPFSAKSDEYGNFTLRHNLSDLRLVAAGRVASADGEWSYEWIGVAPEKEANLTEANATAITGVEMNKAKYAAR